MIQETPIVASNLLNNPESYLTLTGFYLRKTIMDELPQLFSILLGKMSFVGPRAALYNQHDLISYRTINNNIHKVLPGLTGWAQINER